MTQSKLLSLLKSCNPSFQLRPRFGQDVVAVWCNSEYTGYRINEGEIHYRNQRHPVRGKVRGYRELTWLLEKKKTLTPKQGAMIRNAGY